MTDTSAMLATLLRGAYGLLFVASGISACLRQRSVRLAIANYRLISARLVPAFSRLLAILELLAGVLLLSSLWLPTYPLAWATTTGLLTLFCLAIGSALVRGLHIACGCGVLLNGHTLTPMTLLRNLLLLTLLLLPPCWPSSSLLLPVLQ
ncbi:MauE/DoxX family redox-associated membrane protein [Actimicrobium sp. CCI2.3]|uniref:MauE/DoxX family redox-associated membrane protein n=1 Tax=Actimicrobium sp. CCI2.3 TaxID=3048616 RepID=UPI002AB4A222|nr:MauE/DoxX family redox-associated membrane protein [Actimicrobium sp. CCI2.3]MDY7574363.1 MauE/DoxX family redox-associated membrane protein [Actimicrobium sp. CCI2.3]MEB0023524.1 MauE/DoxX family redox-associated membrane protein [Actimicrobium sp. CCI2.3]